MWVSIAVAGCRFLGLEALPWQTASGGELRASIVGGTQAQSAGWCWPAGTASVSFRVLLSEVLLIEGAGLKSSGCVLYRVKSMLPEAGGQVGEVPMAMSWEWLPRAPCFKGRPACEFAGLHHSSISDRSAWDAVASEVSLTKEKDSEPPKSKKQNHIKLPIHRDRAAVL